MTTVLDDQGFVEVELTSTERMVLRIIGVLTLLPGILILIALSYFIAKDGDIKSVLFDFENAPISMTIMNLFMLAVVLSSVWGGVLMILLKKSAWIFTAFFYVLWAITTLTTIIEIVFGTIESSIVLIGALFLFSLITLMYLWRKNVLSYFHVARSEYIILIASAMLIIIGRLILN